MAVPHQAAEDGQGILRRAELALDAGRPELAVSLAREAIRLTPEDGVPYYTLGRALTRLGRHREALAAAKEACRLRPDDGRVAWLVPACLLDLGRVREAARELSDLMVSAPERPTTWAVAALVRLRQRDPRAAEAAAREWARLQPQNATAHGLLGRALFGQRRTDEALAEALAGLRCDPQDRRSLAVQVDCALAQLRFADARTLARDLVRLEPNDRDAERAYARCVGWSLGPFRPLAWWTYTVGRWPWFWRLGAFGGAFFVTGAFAQALPPAAAALPTVGLLLAIYYLLLAGPLFRLAVRRGWLL